MKIAIFSASRDVKNGYGNITYELCEKLKNKVDFTLFLPKNEIRHKNVGYSIEYVLPEMIVSFKTKNVFKYLFLPEIKDIQSFDIVHSLFAFPYCILAARLAKKHKKPLLMGAQGTFGVDPLFHWPEKYFLTQAYNRADLFTVPSQFTKEKIQEFSGTKTPIKIIHNGVDFNRFQKKQNTDDLRNRFGDKKILLTVGGLKSRKGQDIVIKALAKVKKEYNNFCYIIVGDGAWMKDLKLLVENLGLNENVFFAGSLTGDKLVKYFQFCDIYVHTPRNKNWHFEGFGIVYLEASACGKSIIAADSGGIKDAVIENKTGLIVPEEDVNATACAILKLIQNNQLAETLGKNGLEYSRQHDWSLIVLKFLNIYNKLLKL